MSTERRGRPRKAARTHDKHSDGEDYDAGEGAEGRAGQEAGSHTPVQDAAEDAGHQAEDNPKKEQDKSVAEEEAPQPRWPLSAEEVEQLELSRVQEAELKTASRAKTHTRICLGPGDGGESSVGSHMPIFTFVRACAFGLRMARAVPVSSDSRTFALWQDGRSSGSGWRARLQSASKRCPRSGGLRTSPGMPSRLRIAGGGGRRRTTGSTPERLSLQRGKGATCLGRSSRNCSSSCRSSKHCRSARRRIPSGNGTMRSKSLRSTPSTTRCIWPRYYKDISTGLLSTLQHGVFGPGTISINW